MSTAGTERTSHGTETEGRDQSSNERFDPIEGILVLTEEALLLIDQPIEQLPEANIIRIALVDIESIGRTPIQLQIQHDGRITAIYLYHNKRFFGLDNAVDAFIQALPTSRIGLTLASGQPGLVA